MKFESMDDPIVPQPQPERREQFKDKKPKPS